jgi:hypothetical protein
MPSTKPEIDRNVKIAVLHLDTSHASMVPAMKLEILPWIPQSAEAGTTHLAASEVSTLWSSGGQKACTGRHRDADAVPGVGVR